MQRGILDTFCALLYILLAYLCFNSCWVNPPCVEPTGRPCVHDWDVLELVSRGNPWAWRAGAVQMLPSAVVQLVILSCFICLQMSVTWGSADNIPPSLLTLFTSVPCITFQSKLPANKSTSRKPTSQALLSGRDAGARDKEKDTTHRTERTSRNRELLQVRLRRVKIAKRYSLVPGEIEENITIMWRGQEIRVLRLIHKVLPNVNSKLSTVNLLSLLRVLQIRCPVLLKYFLVSSCSSHYFYDHICRGRGRQKNRKEGMGCEGGKR